MTVHHITFKRGNIRERHIKDAQNDDEWPEGELHEVLLDPGEITVEGTPEGIRWLYDWLHWAKKEYRLEDAKYYADEAEAMAQIIWEAVDGDLPDRQRNRRIH